MEIMLVRLAILSTMALQLAAGVQIAPPSADCHWQNGPEKVQAAELIDCFKAGSIVELSGVIIVGDLNVRGMRVSAPFICESCEFSGAFDLRDTVWQGRFDVRGSSFGSVEADGAVFERLAIFSTTEQPATFAGVTSFAYTTFNGRAEFEKAEFKRPVSFLRSHFGQGASFRLAVFDGPSNFSRARFGADTTLEGAVFRGHTWFESAIVAGSLNAGGIFHCDVRFADASVRDELSFDRARFGVGECISQDSEEQSRVGTTREEASRGESEGTKLDLRDLRVGELRLNLKEITQVAGPSVRIMLLELLEEKAKERGDISEANDARYLRLTAQSSSLLDAIFYRWASGYLVRWGPPLRTLVLLLVIGTALRIPGQYRRVRAAGEPQRGKAHLAVIKEVTAVALQTTLSVFWPVFKYKKGKKPIEHMEATLYWVVLFVLLITMGNAIPLIREFMENLL